MEIKNTNTSSKGDFANPFGAWRLNALNWILRIQFFLFLIVIAVEVWVIASNWVAKAYTLPNAFLLYRESIFAYGIAFAIMAGITFIPALGYRFRTWMMLSIYFVLGIILFSLSALNGDAYGFLFVYVVLAAIFLDAPWKFASYISALTVFAVMGWLYLSDFYVLPSQIQYSGLDAYTWVRRWVVFAGLSGSAWLGVTYLLNSFQRNLQRIEAIPYPGQRTPTLLRLLNHLISREQEPRRLFEGVCQFVIESGYDGVWAGMLDSKDSFLEPVIFMGEQRSASIPDCAKDAICTHARVSSYPHLALPILRSGKLFGILVITSYRPIPETEILQFQELANDLAYALENIEIEKQRRAVFQSAVPLFAAHHEGEFWPVVLRSVKSVLRAEGAAIYTYNYEEDRVACTYSDGLSSQYVHDVNQKIQEIPGILLLQNPEPVHVNDVENEHTTIAPPQLLQQEGIQSYATFPLFSGQELLGAFVAYRNTLIPFSQIDMETGQTLAHLVSSSLQNARLFAEARARANEQATLFTAAQEMSASMLNPSNLLETIASQLVKVLDVTSVYMYMMSFDAEENTFVVMAEYWSEGAHAKERKSDLGRRYRVENWWQIHLSLKMGEMVIQQWDDSDLTEYDIAEFQDYGIYTKLYIPFISRGHLVGHAEIWESRYKRKYTQHEIDLALTLGAHSAGVIEKARLIEAERKHNFALTVLHDVGLDLSSELGLTALLEIIVDRAMKLLNASMGCLYLVEPDGNSMKIVVGQGLLKDYIGTKIKFGEGLSGRAAQTGKPLLISDYQNWTGQLPVFADRDVAASLGAPIIWQEKVLGVVNVNDARPNHFSSSDLDIVTLFADQAAIAIENARIYQQLEEREAYFRALTENSAEGVAVMDADGVFTYMSQTEEKILGYPHLELVGQYAFDIVHPNELNRVEKAFFENTLKENENFVVVEYHALHANGSWRVLETTMKNLLHDSNINGVVANFRDITEAKQAEIRLMDAYDSTLAGWARALELRDKETEGHTRRVTQLAITLARMMDIPEDEIIHIQRGATLHDIGKMAVPDDILHKPSSLTAEEREIMRQHPRHAYEMLEPISYLRPALDIPYCHHERWDGQGYPRRLKGRQIPLAARIFAIVDVWDALTSNRPYRTAWEKQKVLAYIVKNSGKAFDPEVVDVFLSLMADTDKEDDRITAI